MNEDIDYMIKLYKTTDLDWMGDKINNPCDLTRHHIIKKQYNGEDSISNYALLTTYSHHLIHYFEIQYNKEYNMLNDLFIELNKSKKEPTKEYYENVLLIIKRIKKDMKNKRRNNSKKR